MGKTDQKFKKGTDKSAIVMVVVCAEDIQYSIFYRISLVTSLQV